VDETWKYRRRNSNHSHGRENAITQLFVFSSERIGLRFNTIQNREKNGNIKSLIAEWQAYKAYERNIANRLRGVSTNSAMC
jgi:hypothetical protein